MLRNTQYAIRKVVKPIRLLEEKYANIMPPFEHILYDGWLLRFTRGYATNNNSVWPLYEGDLPLESKIAFCEAQYAARGSSCGFRLSGLPGHKAIEALLTERGYISDNPNLVMARASVDAPEASITELIMDEWLEIAFRINPVDDPHIGDWKRQVLARLALPGRYAAVMRDGEAYAYGRSVRQGDLLCIEDLWTLPEFRSQGLGTQLIHGLLRLGLQDGAETACLAVNESNTGARRLYERLGFVDRYLYYYVIPEE